ncbi:MAG TPA: septal ring lytic transglycosylase RlpA family protein [Polyangiaceae bacterium]|nr:septal ring lytic transglycosylase RlpA family protein [Polyangiaceae bacterium]
MNCFHRSLFALLLAGAWSCASETVPADHPAPRAPRVAPKPVPPSTGCSDEELARPARQVLRGSASYYANSLAGNPTASGVPYDPGELSAAHRSLPFGTRVRVTRTDAEVPPVCVTVNDRGPYAGRQRIIDLSRRAAERLQMVAKGVVPVRVDVL